ncbi:MFS transporter [Microcoleus sp. FACHB-1515]|uniref:MFS transporter n=1 Tax=Cyanophyceae TaxID=3028117 RepID=UPI00168211CC|nr:MFS transporter [Microcoleus sp. FACHB-1515]MBD2089045.1 MFS transporter [Microcoleus sp. FACHB-1515]
MTSVGEVREGRSLRSRRRHSVKFLVLLAAGCLTTMTGGIVSPVLPEMIQQLDLNPQWAGMLVSMHAITIAIFTPILGILADRVGALRVLIPSLGLYAVFGTAGAFMPSFWPLLAMRALVGAASGGIAAASIGLLGTMYQGDERSRILGYATSAMTTASILVPLIGGWVGQIQWQYAFYLYALGLPLALIAVPILSSKSTQRASSIESGQMRTLVKLLKQPETLRLLLLLVLAASVVYAVIVYTPLYLKQTIGAGPQLNGVVLALRGVGAAIASAVLASRIGKAIGVDRTIALGFVLMALTVGILPFQSDIHSIMLTAVLFGVGFGITVPNVYDGLANQAPQEFRASVMAIGTGGNSLGQFLSPVILGPIWNSFGFTVLFFVAAGVSLLVSAWMLLRKS